MAIRTHQSISGFVASEPQLSHTERGDARLYMKIGIEHYRKEPDNSFTQLETTFHDVIAYRGAAEQGAERTVRFGIDRHSSVRGRCSRFVGWRRDADQPLPMVRAGCGRHSLGACGIPWLPHLVVGRREG